MSVRMYSRSNMKICGTHCMESERKERDQFYRVGGRGGFILQCKIIIFKS